jgi:hypothetical protein
MSSPTKPVNNKQTKKPGHKKRDRLIRYEKMEMMYCKNRTTPFSWNFYYPELAALRYHTVGFSFQGHPVAVGGIGL